MRYCRSKMSFFFTPGLRGMPFQRGESCMSTAVEVWPAGVWKVLCGVVCLQLASNRNSEYERFKAKVKKKKFSWIEGITWWHLSPRLYSCFPVCQKWYFPCSGRKAPTVPLLNFSVTLHLKLRCIRPIIYVQNIVEKQCALVFLPHLQCNCKIQVLHRRLLYIKQ